MISFSLARFHVERKCHLTKKQIQATLHFIKIKKKKKKKLLKDIIDTLYFNRPKIKKESKEGGKKEIQRKKYGVEQMSKYNYSQNTVTSKYSQTHIVAHTRRCQ